MYHNGDNAVAKEMQAEVKARRDIAHDVDSAAQTARQNKIDSVKDAKHTSWKQMPIVENIVNSDPAAEVAKVKAEKLKEDAAKKRDAEARKVEERVRAQLLNTGTVAQVERRLDGGSAA